MEIEIEIEGDGARNAPRTPPPEGGGGGAAPPSAGGRRGGVSKAGRRVKREARPERTACAAARGDGGQAARN